jgi:hypothetical protein
MATVSTASLALPDMRRYVMMTRARESLIVCDPAGPEYVPVAPLAARIASRDGGAK